MSYITLSDLIARVKAKLGASVRHLELSDEDLARLFSEETLKTISVYFPRCVDHVVNIARDRVPGHRSRFYLNAPYEIIRVAELIPHNPGTVAGLYIDGRGVVYGSVIETQPLKDIQSFYENPMTFQFIAPNQVETSPQSPMGVTDFTFILHVKHGSTATLPPGLREQVMKMFELDVKIDLYGIRRYFQTVSTTFGELSLNTEILEGASEKRDELVDLWSLKKHRSSNQRKVWVY